jgi:hypothetical protein
MQRNQIKGKARRERKCKGQGQPAIRTLEQFWCSFNGCEKSHNAIDSFLSLALVQFLSAGVALAGFFPGLWVPRFTH